MAPDQHAVRLDGSGATFKCEIPRFALYGYRQFGVDDDKPVSPDVFAIWRGMQDWTVETGLLPPRIHRSSIPAASGNTPSWMPVNG